MVKKTDVFLFGQFFVATIMASITMIDTVTTTTASTDPNVTFKFKNSELGSVVASVHSPSLREEITTEHSSLTLLQ